MFVRKILSLIAMGALTAAALLAMSSCGGGDTQKPAHTTHTDENVDFICDVCGENMPCDHEDDNRDYKCDNCGEFYEAPVVTADFTVCVNNEDNSPLANTKVIIINSDGESVMEKTTDADGKISGNLPTGSYTVIFEIDIQYVYIEDSSMTIGKEDNNFVYTATDNTPDGSAEKPFFISENTVSYTIPANTTFTFTIKGAERTLIIENANVSVEYKSATYTPDNGCIELRISGSANYNDPPTSFTVTNTSSSDNDIEMNFVSDPGTRENPIPVTASVKCTTDVITNEDIVYYVWNATSEGTVSISSDTLGNIIKLTNLTKSKVSDYTTGEAGEVLTLDGVSTGDEILIEISIKNMTEPEDPLNPTEEELSASGSVEFLLTFAE